MMMFQYPLVASFRRTATVEKSALCICMLTILLIYLKEVSSEQGRPPMVAPGHYDNVQNQYGQHLHSAGGIPPGQPAQNFEEQSKPVQYATGHQQPPPPPHMAQHATGQEQKLLHAPIMQHEKEHIAEHMDVPIDTSKMSEQELQFHYFKMHDNDNNNMLDGTELIKSLIHWHESGQDAPREQHAHQQSPSPKLFTDDELIQLIDPILKMDDTNLDGYIDYPEFIRAQQKTATVH